jgi:transposase
MHLHANAALSLKGRRLLAVSVVSGERTLTEAALAAGVSVRCARKWTTRYRELGEVGLRDRSSAPNVIPHRTSPERVDVITALRHVRFTGPEIAEVLGMPLSTVSAVLKRSGMGKLGRLGLEPAQRYEHRAPGDLIHIDLRNSAASRAALGTASPASTTTTQLSGPTQFVTPRSAGSSCMSRSTITAAWPTPRFSAMRRP